MLQWLKRLVAMSTVALVAACGGNDDPPAPVNIVETAQRDPQFSILVEAIVAADLAGTLSEPGPYTVFAPTNGAFAALLTELGVTKAQLLADKPLLTSVLTYHVVAAKVLKADVPLGRAVGTVEGDIFKADSVGGGVVITDGRNRRSNIVATDIIASNGVIHAVDKVLLPPDKTIVGTASASPDLSILVEAVTAANLAGTLNGTGPFTVFAPTDAAFAGLLAELGITKAALLADTALLTKVLTYHVVAGRVLKAEVPVGTPIVTVEGETFSVGPGFVITDQRARASSITATDILAENGVIHIVDKVILPRP